MSRYSSICTAINLIEVVGKLVKDNGGGTGRTDEVIADLRDVARDVRFGGEWDGDYETIAQALTCCVETGENCNICPYRKEKKGCIGMMKKDAAAAIRAMAKEIAKKEAAEDAAG